MKRLLLILGFVAFAGLINAQNIAISDNDSYTAHSSAMLDVSSDSKGLLVPRMTTVQRNAISPAANGLLVYDTNEDCYYLYNGIWTNLSVGQIWSKNGSYVYLSDVDDNVGIGVSDPETKLLVQADGTNELDESIFAVLNTNGDTVFSVYEEGVRIWVNDCSSGAKASGNRGINIPNTPTPEDVTGTLWARATIPCANS